MYIDIYFWTSVLFHWSLIYQLRIQKWITFRLWHLSMQKIVSSYFESLFCVLQKYSFLKINLYIFLTHQFLVFFSLCCIYGIWKLKYFNINFVLVISESQYIFEAMGLVLFCFVCPLPSNKTLLLRRAGRIWGDLFQEVIIWSSWTCLGPWVWWF